LISFLSSSTTMVQLGVAGAGDAAVVATAVWLLELMTLLLSGGYSVS